MAKKIQIIKNIVQERNTYSVVVLSVIGLILFQILALLATKLFGLTPLKIGAGLLLFLVGAAVILPYSYLVGGLKVEGKAVLYVGLAIALDFFILSWAGPKYLPQVFSMVML